nr:hypothetical protein [Pseudonocardia sp. ICBG601]
MLTIAVPTTNAAGKIGGHTLRATIPFLQRVGEPPCRPSEVEQDLPRTVDQPVHVTESAEGELDVGGLTAAAGHEFEDVAHDAPPHRIGRVVGEQLVEQVAGAWIDPFVAGLTEAGQHTTERELAGRLHRLSNSRDTSEALRGSSRRARCPRRHLGSSRVWLLEPGTRRVAAWDAARATFYPLGRKRPTR